MSETNSAPLGRAVFLSYAREDAEAARRIADALRAFGIEAWFDQSELRGGDSWSQKIRKQIRECALFMPIISATTQGRGEGYFRREWKLGVERTHDMAAGVAFIVPVVIDDTPESGAMVPEEFMHFQWTRMLHGVPSPEFVVQVKRLLEAPRTVSAGRENPTASRRTDTGAAPGRKLLVPAWTLGSLTAVVVGVAVALWIGHGPWTPAAPPSAAVAAVAVPIPVPAALDSKSIAVLPFANFSTDKDNEFFADGLQDEVITALAKIHDLKVISRTSVLAYKNPEGRNLKKIATELGVATVLEGSVQRIGGKVHLNVQLIDARTDEHLWADSYTEELTDVFEIESALAQQVVGALKANFTKDEQALIARRPTQDAEAYNLYLRARVMEQNLSDFPTKEEGERVIAAYALAAAKDPTFSLPHVQSSMFSGVMYWFGNIDATPERKAGALAELQAAQRLAPGAPETRLAQGSYDYTCLNNWKQALAEYRAAEADLPNDAELHYLIGLAYRRLGRYSEALDEFGQAASLNPNDKTTIFTLVETVFGFRRYPQVVDLANRYIVQFPDSVRLQDNRNLAQYELDGDRAAFLRAVAAEPEPPGEREQLEVKFNVAFATGDLAAAERLAADPRLKTIGNEDGSINDPAELYRAMVAYLLGHKAEAGRYADAAIASYRGQAWTQRQEEWVHLGVARAEAYAGRGEDALRDARAALDRLEASDQFSALDMRNEFGRIQVVCGRPDEAISTLREITARPLDVISPNYFRFDPIWSKLRDDPRFEQILQAVKPL